MQGEAKQAALAARREPFGDVEERLFDERAVAHDADLAALLHDEDAVGPVIGRHDIDRALETRRHDVQVQRHGWRRGGEADRRLAGRRSRRRGARLSARQHGHHRPRQQEATQPARTAGIMGRHRWMLPSIGREGRRRSLPGFGALLPCAPGGPLLDRTISGAGALTDLADRAVRVFGQRRGRNPLATRPGSVIVMILLLALAVLLVLAGLEVAADPTPRALSAAAVTNDAAFGDRVYATVEGSVSPDYVETFLDVNGNEEKDADEVSAEWFYFLVDPVSFRGVTVRSIRPPEQVVSESYDFLPATFTGMLRRDERAVSEAKATSGLGFDDLGLDVSDRYVLEDGRGPADPFLTFGLAAVVGLLAGAILVGLSGGYLIYRRDGGPLPERATSMALGERIPLRITGLLRTSDGLIHVREASADLVRYPAAATTDETASAAILAPSSTLIIERRGRPEGVALGLGQLVRLTSGVVMSFRGPRPALRAVAGTGPLLLSFDDEPTRDRGAAELLDETNLGSGLISNDPKEG